MTMNLDLTFLPKVSDSLSYVYVEHSRIEQDQLSLAAFDEKGKIQLPIASLTLLMLGPGTSISHAAVSTAAQSGCLLAWVGEEGVRFYAGGLGETRSAKNLLRQVELYSSVESRKETAKLLYRLRFAENLPDDLTIDQLRGREGVRVREIYRELSSKFGVSWSGRSYSRQNWEASSPINRALSAANACLYGVCHAAIVSLGLSPAIGFIHTGKALSFVYDVADLYKHETSIPCAFSAAVKSSEAIDRHVRLTMRDLFREKRILARIVRDLKSILNIDPAEPSLFDFDAGAPGRLIGEVTDAEGGYNFGNDNP